MRIKIVLSFIVMFVSIVCYADCTEYQALFNLMSHRADLLKDVAANKYCAQQSVYDAKQELAVLNRVACVATDLNLDSENVMLFAQIQMDMSKQIEQNYLNLWQVKPELVPKNYMSLVELRQKIGDIDQQLYFVLASLIKTKQFCSYPEQITEFKSSFASVEMMPQSVDFSHLILKSLALNVNSLSNS